MKLKTFGSAILGSVIGATITTYSILKFVSGHECIWNGIKKGIADEICNVLFDDERNTGRSRKTNTKGVCYYRDYYKCERRKHYE